MEKNRPSVIRRKDSFTWHNTNRKILSPVIKIEIHPTRKEAQRLSALRIRDRENVIYDIQTGFPNEKRQKLQIRHMTEER